MNDAKMSKPNSRGGKKSGIFYLKLSSDTFQQVFGELAKNNQDS